jgi:DNA-binding CsgD family transcriptional regulator
MDMIPALVILYMLLIGVAAWGSGVSFRLRRQYRLPFLRTYHPFILLSFGYALVNFVGEVFVPAVFPGPREALVPAYMIIDLVTIPLLGLLFYLLLAWIVLLLGRRVAPAAKAAFFAVEALFLAAFVVPFSSYFVRGISALTFAAVVILNGVALVMLAAAVLLLMFAPPAGGEPGLGRLARRLSYAYAASLAVLVACLAVSRAAPLEGLTVGRLLPAGMTFLVNLPALLILRASLGSLPAAPGPAFAAVKGLDDLARDAGLSEREKEIVRYAASGLGNREIGERLFISPKTVKNHMTSIYLKTGAGNRVQLANLLHSSEKAVAPEGSEAPED